MRKGMSVLLSSLLLLTMCFGCSSSEKVSKTNNTETKSSQINITKMKQVDVGDGRMTTAVGRGNFDQYDYTEKEFFFTGTANVYETAKNNQKKILSADAPYTNRLIVRYPKDKKKFNGSVYVEIINSTSTVDIDRMWQLSDNEMMRDGYAYVGITSKPIISNNLKKYDAEKYKELSWTNPIKQDNSVDESKLGVFPNSSFKDSEDGLIYDMLTDVGSLLKSDDTLNPLKQLNPTNVYLTGWSQSGSLMLQYKNSFSKESQYDGYLLAGPSYSLVLGMNQSEGAVKKDDKRRSIKVDSKPTIVIHTQSETDDTSGLFEYSSVTHPKYTNTDNKKYAAYEIAGSTHDTTQLTNYYHDDFSDLTRIGLKKSTLEYAGSEETNDNPFEYVVNMSVKRLDQWVKNNVAPPKSSELTKTTNMQSKKNQFGNAKGGIQLPATAVPKFTYHTTSGTWGYKTPLSKEQLASVFTSTSDYKSKVSDCVDKLVKNGYILEEDKDALLKASLQ